MTTARPDMPKVLKCLLSQDQETSRWNGHCLNFDIVTSGRDEEAAWSNLKLVVRHHIEECFEKFPDGLRNTASPDKWTIFNLLAEKNGMKRSDKIHLNLVVPEDEDLWIEAIDLKVKCGQTQTANV